MFTSTRLSWLILSSTRSLGGFPEIRTANLYLHSIEPQRYSISWPWVQRWKQCENTTDDQLLTQLTRISSRLRRLEFHGCQDVQILELKHSSNRSKSVALGFWCWANEMGSIKTLDSIDQCFDVSAYNVDDMLVSELAFSAVDQQRCKSQQKNGITLCKRTEQQQTIAYKNRSVSNYSCVAIPR